MAVGQVAVFRSAAGVLGDASEIVRNARAIGITTFRRHAKGGSVGKGVLTRKIDAPQLLEPDALVPLGVFQVGDAHRLGGNAEGRKQAAELLRR